MTGQLPDCAIETTLSFVGDRWKVLILRELMQGTRRFGELKKGVTGISQKVLTNNLRSMEEDGLLTRTIYAEVPPRVEYALTDRGRSLLPVLDALRAWGEAHKEQSMQAILDGAASKDVPTVEAPETAPEEST